MELPKEFCHAMEALLGEEAEAFLKVIKSLIAGDCGAIL